MNITAYFSKIILGCTLLFLWAPTAHGMGFLRRFVKPGAILNFAYNFGTWERSKVDAQGKPVLGENGKQVFERLHTLRDDHAFSDYEAVQIADTINHIKNHGSETSSLFVENPNDVEHPFAPYKGYNGYDQHMLATPLTSYRGLLYGLHYAALREKFDVKNIDCRSTIEPGIESITPAGKTIIDPDNRNTIPISNVVDVLKNYAQETKELQQKTDISIPYTNLTIANLRKKLRPHRGKTMYELFEGKKRKDMIYSSCFTPYKYPAAFMLAVGHKLIENRALVEMSRKDTTITDRYLAMGGGHIDNLENPLRAQGWRLIAESGVSSYQNDLEYYRRDSLHSAVDIAGHFRTLPPRGAPTPPAPGFFARLKNIFSYRQPRNTVKIQIQKHNK